MTTYTVEDEEDEEAEQAAQAEEVPETARGEEVRRRRQASRIMMEATELGTAANSYTYDLEGRSE